MKPHPRIRKTIKWGGAAVTGLLVVVWIASGWWMLTWEYGKNNQWAIGSGRLLVQLQAGIPPVPNPQFAWGAGGTGQRWTCRWWFSYHSDSFADSRAPTGGIRYTIALVPLWILFGPLLLITVAAWRLDTLARRRAKGGLNLCPKCGYDRTGILQDAKCPECGLVPSSN